MWTDNASRPGPGEVWRVSLDPTRGSETSKDRPAVVVSTTAFGFLCVRIAVPITNWDDKHKNYPWRVPLSPSPTNGLTKRSAADCGQVRTLSVERFSERIGVLSAEELLDVKAGLALAMDIDTSEFTGSAC